MLFVYDRLWAMMEAKNVTKYRLRMKHGFDQKTINRLKAGQNVDTSTLDRLCTILDCAIEDICEHKKD